MFNDDSWSPILCHGNSLTMKMPLGTLIIAPVLNDRQAIDGFRLVNLPDDMNEMVHEFAFNRDEMQQISGFLNLLERTACQK